MLSLLLRSLAAIRVAAVAFYLPIGAALAMSACAQGAVRPLNRGFSMVRSNTSTPWG